MLKCSVGRFKRTISRRRRVIGDVGQDTRSQMERVFLPITGSLHVRWPQSCVSCAQTTNRTIVVTPSYTGQVSYKRQLRESLGIPVPQCHSCASLKRRLDLYWQIPAAIGVALGLYALFSPETFGAKGVHKTAVWFWLIFIVPFIGVLFGQIAYSLLWLFGDRRFRGLRSPGWLLVSAFSNKWAGVLGCWITLDRMTSKQGILRLWIEFSNKEYATKFRELNPTCTID